MAHHLLISHTISMELDQNIKQLGLESVPIWDVGVIGTGFTRYATILALPASLTVCLGSNPSSISDPAFP